MKIFFFAFSWIFLSTGVILISVAGIQFYLQGITWRDFLGNPSEAVRASIAGNIGGQNQTEISTFLEIQDARAQLVTNFLARYNSPLKPHEEYGKLFVEIADEQEMDFRLLPAIAMQESNLCKVTPPGSYNCLGLGVHAKGTWEFASYAENFRAAANVLKTNYIDKGLVTPEQIMRKYTPSSNGSWAVSVNQWMAEMRFDDRGAGRSAKQDADLLEFVAPN
ncbi:MAG: hypothetical protein A2632_03035 [Candidatus Pacebacteria bacterium RIFCSPHIGHO2_01_FULL_46_16]|nr:MAG: hypothetical protein A2632_03035 [Candidatus Pacebacteria bacterium RIFCSPHIGHO2_01_FULL_46_16]OGJ21520.1 MAG: hypothetical protein A3J60_03395 [Candidatus Pacebacteria bacterium RIFCSPHIGHO2_02_FULL_46_9]OGJ38962.1 MAG: hypothetical protein A3A82_02350 [Candidatus Pacebacteria bacterium RIFCSPLOWO2_01_FULL_47_12]